MAIVFVAFNKVYTMQYFIWWLVLLPLVAPRLVDGFLRHWVCVIAAVAVYAASYGVWLWYAYRLEFQGENTMSELFVSSLAIFAANVVLIVMHIVLYEPKTVKEE